MPRINAEYREEAKKKILDAAVEVATEEGWSALTLDALARKIGVTKGAFYSYFENSGTLMEDVTVAIIRKLRGHVVEYLAETDDIHVAIERLAAFIFLQPKPFIPVFFQAIATMPRNPAFLRRISVMFDENSALFVQEFARFRERGQIPADVDLEDATRAIYCMMIGLGFSTHMLGKDADMSRRIWIDTVEKILHIVPANRA